MEYTMKQQHRPFPSSSQMAMTRRGIFCQLPPNEDFTKENKHQENKTHKRNTKQDKMVRALEAIRLLAFDTTEGSKKSSTCTAQTVATLSDDATEESNEEFKPVNRTKLVALRPLPIINRSIRPSTYLSSDTSSEIGERLSVDFEIDYPRYICFYAKKYSDDLTVFSGYGQPQPTHSNSRRLSAATLEEWNRRCDEEGGVFRRENYASDVLNLNSKLSMTLNQHQHHQHGAGQSIDRRHSCTLSPIETDASFHETSDEDISLTYSHDD
jgi:hypothetical protein